MGKIVPIIICGGAGTRLWPLSRRSKPKQFLKIEDDFSLFQKTILRCKAECFDQTPIIVSSADYRFLVAEELHEIGVTADILLEPVARNTCAAIAAGALAATKRGEDVQCLVLAADHHIDDKGSFAASAKKASLIAQRGYIVTFGIAPTGANPDYGYMKPAGELLEGFLCDSFIEKPSEEDAQKLINDGYLWNSGNFLFTAKLFLGELQIYQPEVFKQVSQSLARAKSDLDFLRLDHDFFAGAPAISVDHGLMMQTDKCAVLPVSYAWNDIGSWHGFSQILKPDAAGNCVVGDLHAVKSCNNIVHSHDHLTTLIGVDDLVVAATRDCLLVAARNQSQAVKELVDNLEAQGYSQAHGSQQEFRPWGNFEAIEDSPFCKVKRLTVLPGGSLSLQKHQFRSEHWIVVHGVAEVQLGSQIIILEANQSICIPCGTEHRLTNNQDEDLIIIEVQTGSYFGEDDIIRLDDRYNRLGDDGDNDQ